MYEAKIEYMKIVPSNSGGRLLMGDRDVFDFLPASGSTETDRKGRRAIYSRPEVLVIEIWE